ncbi:MAG TPA: serine/threonine-protein kinase [Kofleriaceae bacterium]
MTQRIGAYEIVQHLASGGMGRVYLARTNGPGGFERYVVIKLLELHVPEDDPRMGMFLDEARVIGTMYHQHIAPAFALERDVDGRVFLVMDYIHGKSAAMVFDRTLDLDAALPLDFVITVCTAAAAALHYAHTRRGRDGRALGVVHRDVSLSNLMIGFDGAVKLIDFGIVKAVDRSTITQVGFVRGKVGYMAPEQVDGSAVDHRSDIFALGVVLYELATMTRAFRDETDISTMERIKRVDYAPPSQVVHSFPVELEAIIAKTLRRHPADRYQDADSLARELAAFAHSHRYVMGDAAITEVMAQLFEDRIEPWLVEQGAPKYVDDGGTVPVDTTLDRVVPRRDTPRAIRRHLRTASELVELGSSKDRADHTPTTVHHASVAKELPLRSPPSGPIAVLEAVVPPPVVAKPSGPKPSGQLAAARPIAQRRRSWLVWALPLSIVAVSGAAAWAIHEGFLGESESHRDGGVVEHVRSDATISIAADAAEPAEALPATVRVRVETSPSDATVLLDGNKLGHTPLDIEVKSDRETHTMKIRRRGYETQVLKVLLDGEINQQIWLERQND